MWKVGGSVRLKTELNHFPDISGLPDLSSISCYFHDLLLFRFIHTVHKLAIKSVLITCGVQYWKACINKQRSHSLGYKKFQRLFQDPRSILHDPVVSQQCLNIATNSSYGVWGSAVSSHSGVWEGGLVTKAFLAYVQPRKHTW